MAAKIPYSFTVELPDKGKFGFLLPARKIKTVGEELWAATGVVSDVLVFSACSVLGRERWSPGKFDKISEDLSK